MTAAGSSTGGAPDRRVVLVVGDVIDDVIVRPLEATNRGSDTRARIEPTLGGSGANQAVWLAEYGAPVRFVGRVGRTDLARHEHAFAAAGVDARLIADDRRPTGTIVIIVDPDDGERDMYTDRGANLALAPEDLPDHLLDGVGYLHLSGYSLFDASVRDAVLGFVGRARARGIGLSLDPASSAFLHEVGPKALMDAIGPVQLLLPNLDEGRLLTGEHDVDVVATTLLAHAEVVALKLGAEGALVARRDGPSIRVRAVAAEVVDTTGAGDAFCGAYLAAMISGEDAEGAARAAVGAGARAVGAPGARPR